MKVSVLLNYNYGYYWYRDKNISVKGFVYNDQQEVLQNEALVAYFDHIYTEADFRERLQQANGLFAVVIERPDLLLFAVDRTRTFPLFYSVLEDSLILSDAAEKAAGSTPTISVQAKEEFLFTGFVTGSRTLLTSVQQVEAGAYRCYDGTMQMAFYHLYVMDQTITKPFDALAQQFVDLLNATGKRLINALKGRTAVLPLSGGYDSRLIAVLLQQNNYNKIICYTYGIPSSPEVKTSRKVARQLNLPWHFIPYTPETVGNFLDTPQFQDYFLFASNYTSSFFTQDYFAVKFLTEKKYIPEDAVFIPGHAGDFVGGSHLVEGIQQDNVATLIVRKHYLLKKGDQAAFTETITTPDRKAVPYEIFENWNLKERQSKFIVNSVRTYEFWGYEHLLPFWDREIVLFFQNIPFGYKLNKKLFDFVLFEYFFKPYKVDFPKVQYPFIIQKTLGLFNRGRRLLFSDDNNFKLIARHFLKERDLQLHWDSTRVNINSIQATWYISRLEEEFAKLLTKTQSH